MANGPGRRKRRLHLQRKSKPIVKKVPGLPGIRVSMLDFMKLIK